MEVAIVFIGLFGILLVIGAALGLVAFTRLSKVDQNDLVRIPDLLRRVTELERRLGIGQEAKPVTAEPVPPPVVRAPVPRPPSPVPRRRSGFEKSVVTRHRPLRPSSQLSTLNFLWQPQTISEKEWR